MTGLPEHQSQRGNALLRPAIRNFKSAGFLGMDAPPTPGRHPKPLFPLRLEHSSFCGPAASTPHPPGAPPSGWGGLRASLSSLNPRGQQNSGSAQVHALPGGQRGRFAQKLNSKSLSHSKEKEETNINHGFLLIRLFTQKCTLKISSLRKPEEPRSPSL